MNRKENKPAVFSQEVLDSPIVQSYLKRTETLGQLTMEKEKELVSKRDIEILLGYHYPILIALAQRCSEDRGVPFEDILQAGIEHILKKFTTFNGSTYRFSTWLSIQSFSEMMRIGHTEHWNHMYIPTNVAVMVSKVRQILDINE